jgi:excisionase family DNA binding protein
MARSNAETKSKVLGPLEILKTKEFLSIGEACELIGISRMTLHRQIKAGKIKVGGIGRRVIIRKKDLEDFLIR